MSNMALAVAFYAHIGLLQLTAFVCRQAYVTNLNAAEEKYAEAVAVGNLSGAIALQSAIRFNGGGHINHSIFWTNLCPSSQTDIAPNADRHGTSSPHFPTVVFPRLFGSGMFPL